jgi:hypothetical protein
MSRSINNVFHIIVWHWQFNQGQFNQGLKLYPMMVSEKYGQGARIINDQCQEQKNRLT